MALFLAKILPYMENIEVISRQDFINYNNIESQYRQTNKLVKIVQNEELFEKLDAVGSKNFFHYLKWLGLIKDPNLLILSPTQHYYYEAEELKKIKILINPRQLNDIKQLMNFLENIFQILSDGSYFIGCFFDKNDRNGLVPDSHKLLPATEGWIDRTANVIALRIPFLIRLYRKIDLRTKRYLNNGTVTILLEEALLKVLDMTKLDGLTYFCAQKIQTI
jgi:hypothetical protein